MSQETPPTRKVEELSAGQHRPPLLCRFTKVGSPCVLASGARGSPILKSAISDSALITLPGPLASHPLLLSSCPAGTIGVNCSDPLLRVEFARCVCAAWCVANIPGLKDDEEEQSNASCEAIVRFCNINRITTSTPFTCRYCFGRLLASAFSHVGLILPHYD